MKKGFSLVELLAVIVVLGIVGLIVMPSIDRFIKRTDDIAYESAKQSIVDSAKNWEADNVHQLPRHHGDSYEVYLSQLIQGNYVRLDLTNPRTGEPFPDDLKVIITNVYGTHEYEVEYTY